MFPSKDREVLLYAISEIESRKKRFKEQSFSNFNILSSIEFGKVNLRNIRENDIRDTYSVLFSRIVLKFFFNT